MANKYIAKPSQIVLDQKTLRPVAQADEFGVIDEAAIGAGLVAELKARVAAQFPAGYLATFTVKDSGGAAIEGASVAVNGFTLASGADGKAAVYLAPGNYDYTVTAAGKADAAGSVTIAGAAVSKTVTLADA